SFLRINRLEFAGGKSRHCADPAAGRRLSFRGDRGEGRPGLLDPRSGCFAVPPSLPPARPDGPDCRSVLFSLDLVGSKPQENLDSTPDHRWFAGKLGSGSSLNIYADKPSYL